MLEVFLAAAATAVATGVGVIPVALLGPRVAEQRALMLGATAGVMSVASIAGLLIPAFDEGGTLLQVTVGLLAGTVFLLAARRLVEGRSAASAPTRTSILVFAVLLVHSLPEGFAIGTAYASATAGLGLFIVLAIGIQNVPEGTSVALPMAAAGMSTSRQFWAAVLTSVPQPIGAVIAYVLVEEISELLPVSFSFAAGAMLALVVVELMPSALVAGRARGDGLGGSARAGLGLLAGALVMVALSSALGV